MLDSAAFFKHIKDWIVYSQRFLYTHPERPELTCYGLGSNAGGNSWGMQTNQKALAAFRQGIKEIIIPKANERDIQDIPLEVRNQIKFIAVTDVAEVFDKAINFNK